MLQKKSPKNLVMVFVPLLFSVGCKNRSPMKSSETATNQDVAQSVSSRIVDVSKEPKLRLNNSEFGGTTFTGDVKFKSVINVRGVPCFITETDVVYCLGDYLLTDGAPPKFKWNNIIDKDIKADPELTYAVRHNFSATTYGVLFVDSDGKIKATSSTARVFDSTETIDGVIHSVKKVENYDVFDRLGKMSQVSIGTVTSLKKTLICSLSEVGKLACIDTVQEYGLLGLGSGGYLKPDGTPDNWNVYVEFDKLNEMGPFVEVVAGRDSGCALNAKGFIRCWGYPNYARAVSHVGRTGVDSRYYGNMRHSGDDLFDIFLNGKKGGGQKIVNPGFPGGLSLVPRDTAGPYKGLWLRGHYACTNVNLKGVGFRGYCWGGGVEGLSGASGTDVLDQNYLKNWTAYPQNPDSKLTEQVSEGFDFDFTYHDQMGAFVVSEQSKSGNAYSGEFPTTDNGVLLSTGEIVDLVSDGLQIAAIDSLGDVHVWGIDVEHDSKRFQTGSANMRPLFPKNLGKYRVKSLAATCIVTLDGKGVCSGKLSKE